MRLPNHVQPFLVCLLMAVVVPRSRAVEVKPSIRRTPVVQAVEKALSSVVNIGTSQMVKVLHSDPQRRARGDLFERILHDYFGPPPLPGMKVQTSLGSGIIIHPDGFILTNYHVVERASAIKVTLADESTYLARVLARDELSDLALIRIHPATLLSAVTFAEDNDLMLGETVIAVGNPFGLGHSVSVGVLSAKNREAKIENQILFSDILQTDAAINPGSSGGPLLNIYGDLMGVNVSINPDAQNIGFAVPVKRVRRLLGHWLSPRLLKRLWLGMDLKDREGEVVIGYVDEDGPAARARLKQGDRIRSFGDTAVRSVYDLNLKLLDFNIGDSISMVIDQEQGPTAVNLVASEVPKPSGKKLAEKLLGVEFAPRRQAEKMVRIKFRTGLWIWKIREGSVSEKRGIHPGLLLTRINDVEIGSLEDVGMALENVRPGHTVSMDMVSITEMEPFILVQTTLNLEVE